MDLLPHDRLARHEAGGPNPSGECLHRGRDWSARTAVTRAPAGTRRTVPLRHSEKRHGGEIKTTAVVGERFSRRREAFLENEVPGIELVIPDINTTAQLESPGTPPAVTRLTLNTTKPGDPLLKFYGLDVLKRGEHGAVISKAVADALRIKYHEVKDTERLAVDGEPEVLLRVTRTDDEPTPGGPAGRTLTLAIRGIFEPGGSSSSSSTAYLDRELMDQIQDYKMGRSVESLGWPGSKTSAAIYYDGYLAFTETPYNSTDLERLHNRGFEARLLDPAGPQTDRATRVLYGLLRPHKINVYHVRPGRGGEPDKTSPSEIEQVTPRDDVVMAWSPPTLRSIDGVQHRVLGVSVNARWLRPIFYNQTTRLTADPTELRVMWPHPAPAGVKKSPPGPVLTQGTAAIPLAGVPLPNPIPDPAAGLAKLSTTVGRGAGRVPVLGRLAGWLATAASSKPPLAIVPATLAAHLAEVDRGRLVFDKQLSIFALAPTENTYLEARVYASTLDVIPEVDDHLREALYYNTYSSKTRVKEMRKYSATLDALVRTVLTAVLVFGTFTTLFVFGDVTSRKRGAIGIMRIMGMPPSGVFGIVLVRALVVGTSGFVLTTLAGYGLARLLALQYGEICKISTWHVEQVFAVALACCLAGVLAPAWRRLDSTPSTRFRRRGPNNDTEHVTGHGCLPEKCHASTTHFGPSLEHHCDRGLCLDRSECWSTGDGSAGKQDDGSYR